MQRSLFTGMTKLEYGAIPHNSGENRNPMDRDSGGLIVMKHALETQPDLALRRPTRSYMAASWQLGIRANWYEDADNFVNLRGQRRV